MTDETPPRRDDQQVIDELERLQQAIRATRRERERAEAAFAGYLQVFRSETDEGEAAEPRLVRYQRDDADAGALDERPDQPAGSLHQFFAEEEPAPAAPSETAEAGEPASALPLAPVPLLRPTLGARMPGSRATASGPDAADPGEPSASGSPDPMAEIMRRLRAPDASAPAAAPDRRTEVAPARGAGGQTYGVLAIVLLVLGGLAWWLMRPAAPPLERSTAPAAAAAPTAPEEPVTEPAGPVEPPPPAAPLQVIVRTTRHVWLRLIVDGELRLEREVPAGERYALGGQQTVVVRAGDAGAVTVEVDGAAAEPLGADGSVLTRRFERR